MSPRCNTPHHAGAQEDLVLGGSDHIEFNDQDRGDEEIRSGRNTRKTKEVKAKRDNKKKLVTYG